MRGCNQSIEKRTSERKTTIRRRLLCGCLLIMMITLLAGCSINPNEEAPMPPEPPISSENAQAPPESIIKNTENETIKGTATRIDRIYEEYDYSGWQMATWFPGVYSMIPEGLEEEDEYSLVIGNPDGSSSSTRKDVAGSMVVWTNSIPDLPTPEAVVLNIVKAICAEGMDVEYGVFRIRQLPSIRNFVLPEGYYYKRIGANISGDAGSDNWDTQVFFTFWPEDEKRMFSFSMKLNIAEAISDNNITYEDFFKLANSSYVEGVNPEEYFTEFTGIVQKFR